MRWIKPSPVKGTVKAPSSKSMMGRAVAAALLADDVTVLQNGSSCDDARVAITLAEALGAGIGRDKGTLFIRGTEGMPKPQTTILECGESGLSMRMFTPIVSLLPTRMTLTASGSLRTRPMGMAEQMNALGVSCSTNQGHAPIQVRGPLKGGQVRVDGAVSSQLLTGLLLALPLCKNDSRILVSNLKSTPYIRMTVELLKHFDINTSFDEEAMELIIKGNQTYRSCTYTVEGDWSGAAFLLVAGATAGSVKVTGLDAASPQADRAVLQVLQRIGARVEIGEGYVVVEKGGLEPFEFDATHCPDLFPPLVALAASCHGKSVIHGLERLLHKESNRSRALASEFARLSIMLQAEGDTMVIPGGQVQGGRVDSHGDHRIAMACAIAGLTARAPVAIDGAACVSKSYPAFFSDLQAIEAAA